MSHIRHHVWKCLARCKKEVKGEASLLVTNALLNGAAHLAILTSEAPEGRVGSPAPAWCHSACRMSSEMFIRRWMLHFRFPSSKLRAFWLILETVMDLSWRIYSAEPDTSQLDASAMAAWACTVPQHKVELITQDTSFDCLHPKIYIWLWMWKKTNSKEVSLHWACSVPERKLRVECLWGCLWIYLIFPL